MAYADYQAALSTRLDDDAKNKLRSQMASSHLPEGGTRMKGAATGFSARGWLGQFLVIDPKARIVAVRMRSARNSDYTDTTYTERDGFHEFPDAVHALVTPATR
jgi:CubicO group peptidase (beta-lactamase class C family)